MNTKGGKNMKGTVIKKDGEPQGHDFKIKGNDGIEYFAHVGDLSSNEELVLYNDERDDA